MTDSTKPRSRASFEPELTDHEYDGIQEYDNPLPRWWVWIFWGSIVFSGGYYFHYHLSGQGESVAAGYEADLRDYREMLAKQAVGEKVTEEGLATLMANDTLMSDAKLTWDKRCVECHAGNGEGKIGPNLTDDHWIHGSGKLMDIYEVVAAGVPSKGMPEWSRQLKPIELQKVVAYVGRMRGKNLQGRPAEGDKVELSQLEPAAEPATASK